MEGFIKNVKAGMRLAFGRKITKSDFVISWAQVLLFLVVLLLIDIVFEFLGDSLGWQLFFVYWGVFCFVLAILILIFGLANGKEFLLVLFSSNIIVDILSFYTLIEPNDETDWFWLIYILAAISYCVLILFGLYVLYRSLRLVYEKSRLTCFLSSLISILLVIGISMGILYKDEFNQILSLDDDVIWADDDEVEEDQVSVEKTYYKQSSLLKSQLSKLSQNNPNKKDLYLIGFASYSYQDVFKKEISYVLDSIQRRFDGLVQSIQLINHKETVEEIALANKPNLQRVLNIISDKMDINNDVAMLYLTSHGSKDGVLSANFWPIEPEPMNATQLKEILDESNIKWRIIFVSACYSGTFIEPLKTDYSLIITASDKQKTSFGCDNERELTYFAEAYFKEALSKSDSLLTAFEAAKTWVTEKEISEEKEPSEPQIFIGREMQQYLEQFEAQAQAK